VSPPPEASAALHDRLSACDLCPQACGVDRMAGELGTCRTGARAVVASSGPHHGEERVLVGRGGSGTIFFAGCNLRCLFCQNHDISQRVTGPGLEPQALAALMLRLEASGCENINLVTPTHVVHAVAQAVGEARAQGLRLPVVYNCGGYERAEIIAQLEGLVQIYMPDFKWGQAEAGERYSGARDYPAHAEGALAEMYRQVGPLQRSRAGVATQGVLVRHLVMPGDLAAGRAVVDAVARAAPGAAINIMGQYRPAYRAPRQPALARSLASRDVSQLRRYAASQGLERVDGP
jgi:putative pyruvate formate lyase activating enzyme